MGRVSADIMCTSVRRNACVPLQHVQCVSAWRATETGATSRQVGLIPRTLSSCAPRSGAALPNTNCVTTVRTVLRYTRLSHEVRATPRPRSQTDETRERRERGHEQHRAEARRSSSAPAEAEMLPQSTGSPVSLASRTA